MSKVENKPKISNLNDNANNIENSKIKALLENTTSNVNDLTRNENRKIKIDIKNNKNNLYFNYDLFEKEIDPNKISKTSKKIILSVESKIKIEIPSLYENIYKLSNYKYHVNKDLQSKVKDLLLKESPHIISSLSSGGLDTKLLHSNIKITKSFLKLRETISPTNTPDIIKKSSLNKSNLSINKTFDNSILNIRKKPFEAKRSNILNKVFEHPNNKEQNQSELYHSPSFNYNSFKRQMSQTSHSKINGTKIKPVLTRKQTQAAIFGIKSNMNIHGDCNKSALIINPEQNHKRKNSLLNKINLNIRKTNQNLNNPDEFYSNYFQSILGVEKISIGKNDNIKLRRINSPNRAKKEKSKGIKKRNTMWRLDIDYKQ